MRRTKIGATLGPPPHGPGAPRAGLHAGVDVVRLGLAHGTVDEHRARVEQVRDLAERRGRTVGVLADLPGPKVRAGTFPEGGAFLAEGDEVMVARGDLGIDFPIADVPHLQKQIIRACGARGLPVVTATQMLESMVTAPSPTRAEASDVANAVYDGSDALMLSAETAIGHDPALAVRTMARIAQRAETDDRHGSRPGSLPQKSTPAAVTVAMTRAAGQAAAELAVDA